MGVVAIFVFSLLYLSPGDPAVVIGGDTATLEDIAKIREKLGLDRPFLVQFGTWLDRAVMAFAVLGFSFPVFVTGYILIFSLSIWADLLPVQGYVSITNGFWKFLPNMVLPSLALGMVYIALIARITRASMLDVLSQDYIRTAHSKGLSKPNLLFGHALTNA